MVPQLYQRIKLFAAFLPVIFGCVLFALAVPSLAVGEQDILGYWRNDEELTQINFKPNGVVEWTFTYKGFGDTSTCTGHYTVKGDSIDVDLNKNLQTLAVSQGKLVLKEKGKVLNFFRAYPIVPRPSKFYDTIIVTFPRTTPATSVEAAVLKLEPVQLTIYGAQDGKRTISVVLERSLTHSSLQKAQADKTFSSAKLAGPPGKDRMPEPGMYWPVGDARDELMYDLKGDSKKAADTLSGLGGTRLPGTSMNIIRFANGHALAAALTLSTDANFGAVSPHLASQADHVLTLEVDTTTSKEEIEQALLKLSPQYIYIAKPEKGRQAIAIRTAGPDALRKALAKARTDKTFVRANMPNTEAKRVWLWDYNINTVDNFTPPWNELMVYKAQKVSDENFNQSLKRLGGTVADKGQTVTLLRFEGPHIISGFLKAIADPDFYGPSQNMRLGE